MFELHDVRPDVAVLEAEYQRLLGFPRHRLLEGRVRELADWARDWYAVHGRPWIYARQTDAVRISDDRLTIAGTEFGSSSLRDRFATAQATQAVLVAVTAGMECETRARELWQESKPDEYFFLEVYGSAVVEHLIMVANGRICAWADGQELVALPHYSPGYSGWDVAEQTKLWNLIQPPEEPRRPGRLEVLDTGMLRPKKSLLALVGLTANRAAARQFARLVPCEHCALPGCQFRRAPYQFSLPPLEDVGQLQGATTESSNQSPANTTNQPAPKYSINDRALRKWSQERLELRTLNDGSIEARFRYEGTTCTNLGQPLEFHYQVKLSPAPDDHRITEASCAPAPGDIGHTRQCEYLHDAVSLMGCIASEKPLLGRPLDEVLHWERPANPAGCYCDLERRNHKWGLVLEVIHFALAQRRRESSASGEIP